MEGDSGGCLDHRDVLEHLGADIREVVFGVHVLDWFDGVVELSVVV